MQLYLPDQLEKVLCCYQGQNTYDLHLVFGILLDFLNTIASIRPVIDAYAFKLRLMAPSCGILSLLERPLVCFSLSSKGVFFYSINGRFQNVALFNDLSC